MSKEWDTAEQWCRIEQGKTPRYRSPWYKAPFEYEDQQKQADTFQAEQEEVLDKPVEEALED